MPKVSLVVCLYKEADLLERLLQKASGCFDDFVVVHDGPEVIGNERTTEAGRADYAAGWQPPEALSLKEPGSPHKELAIDYANLPPDGSIPTGYRLLEGMPKPGTIHELVNKHGGRFFEGPRCFQQEPHWPFAWLQAKHNWILKLDADEFPSEDMLRWLEEFRRSPEPADNISGYTCIWPMWDGKKTLTRKYPRDRIFLFSKTRASFFGMVEQVPTADCAYEPVELILHHQPKRRSSSVFNYLVRKQAYRWRSVIVDTLQRSPVDLPCWRWSDPDWPIGWHAMLERPLATGFMRLFIYPLYGLRRQWKYERRVFIRSFFGGNVHHFLICLLLMSKKLKKRFS